MNTTAESRRGILAEAKGEKREEFVNLLTEAYWMEIESVMNYIACSINLEGIRAKEVGDALADDVRDELGHAQRFARRIKELHGIVPGSFDFDASQRELQPPASETDVARVIKGVLTAEAAGIDHYNRIIEVTDGVDWVTQDLAIEILRDEETHLRLFEGFLREYETIT